MNTVTSNDGTTIAFDQSGEGQAVILVGGGSVDRMANAPLAALLARHFTVFNYDRRGRGDSGDTAPYAVEREVEDLEALINEAGGAAFVYGTSSGAALALEAAASGLPIAKLALWEPPFILDDSRPRPPADTARTFTELVSAGRRGEAVEYFMSKVVGLPPEFVAGARNAPWWASQEALAHTLAYDATIMGDYSLPTGRAAAVTVPTLVIDGRSSFAFMGESADALAATLPDGRRRTLDGQEHNVDPEALAPVLEEFFVTDNTNTQAQQQSPRPNPALKSLDVLVGTWNLTGRESGPDGEIHGRLTFEWMEGGFYLIQHVDIDYVGRKIKGVEYIGYDDSNDTLKSYFFSNTGPGPLGGVALEYVWEISEDALTIWGGYVGSPASFKGRFSDDRNSGTGRWEWPGGGYEATMTRVE